MRVTNGIPLGCSLLLPVGTVICLQTLKALSTATMPVKEVRAALRTARPEEADLDLARLPPNSVPPPQHRLLEGTVRVFEQGIAFADAIGFHACPLEANMCVTNGIPLESPLLTG
jgi:hypothetical protein